VLKISLQIFVLVFGNIIFEVLKISLQIFVLVFGKFGSLSQNSSPLLVSKAGYGPVGMWFICSNKVVSQKNDLFTIVTLHNNLFVIDSLTICTAQIVPSHTVCIDER